MRDLLIASMIVAVVALAGNMVLHSGDVVADSAYALEEKVVTKIIDGDTLVAEGDTIRLLGMDADERGYPCYSAAKVRLEELTLNKKVKLERENEDKDRYGRYLRYVFLEETNINLRLVEEGLAVARFPDESGKYRSQLIEAEAEARDSLTGCKWKE